MPVVKSEAMVKPDAAQGLSPAIVIRCDGSSAIGMGHVSRCLALAGELRDTHQCATTFAMRDPESAGVKAVRAAGYPVEIVSASERTDYGDWLRSVLPSQSARALVVDVRDALSRASLEMCGRAGIIVATIDDGSERRLASDLAFYPPVPQVAEMDWSGFTGRRYTGWEWVILKREFATAEAGEAGGEGRACDVLVTMGGSDQAGMTEFTLGALDILDAPLTVRVVVGPAFARAEKIIDTAARSRHSVEVSRAPSSMAPLMRSSRLAVSSFGVSAYELAACGVPAVHLCLTDDHARSSSVFDREGIARTVGVFGRITPQQVANAVLELRGAADLRKTMGERARQLVDGRGAGRVAAAIVERLRP